MTLIPIVNAYVDNGYEGHYPGKNAIGRRSRQVIVASCGEGEQQYASGRI